MSDGAAIVFIHPPLGCEVRAISGRTEFLREAVVSVRGREVLFLVGAAMADSTCCGEGGVGYALVAGRLLEDRGQDPGGRRKSLVEPVTGEKDQRDIEAAIRALEPVAQVIFWNGDPLAPDPNPS